MTLPCGKLYVLILSDLSPDPILLFLSLERCSSIFFLSNSYNLERKILRSRVYEAEKRKKDQERSINRRSQIGTGDRSERIRTYNFPQGRVTDHRINLTLHKLDEFLSGEIHEEINQELRLKEQNLKLESLQ